MPSEISGKASSDIENVDWSICTGLPTVVRFGSSSSHTSQSSGDICRICHCENDPQNPLLTPCYCSGSLKYVHQACLQQWLTASATNSCELCKFPFIMHTKIKPFNEWRSLDMSGVERRRLFCSVLFHCAAALCVIWSLCVLIERAAEEVKRGLIGWPFWTKLVVVTVGLTGGVVFMYIQCRQYLHLCNRLRARNRIILIQNAPEKVHQSHSPIPVRNLPQNSSSSLTGIGINNNSNANNYIRQQQQQQQFQLQQHLQQQSQGQIIANIENNPLHYERDWTLDDISQVSFKTFPQQGSGSLTPLAFHDSVHNIYEQQQQPQITTKMTNSSNNSSHNSSTEHIFNQIPNITATSITSTPTTAGTITTTIMPLTPTPSSSSTPRTNDLSLFKIDTEQLKIPNSAVFIENRDILNDTSYPKLYHRHSTILQTPDIQDNFNKIINKDLRRYSDTKLLQQQQQKFINNNSNNQIIFNVTNILGPTIQTTTDNNISIINNQPQITDIIFESSGQSNFDPLELNIQEMLELDIKTQQLERKSQLSLNNQQIYSNIGIDGIIGIDDDNYSGDVCSNTGSGVNKNIFKSLPNLSGSSENLLQ